MFIIGITITLLKDETFKYTLAGSEGCMIAIAPAKSENVPLASGDTRFFKTPIVFYISCFLSFMVLF